jgi:cytochrome c peroxidase
MKKTIPLIILLFTTLFSNIITPIPTNLPVNKEKVKLGELLFNDTRLSKNNTIACASCHFLDEGGDDNLPVSIGIYGLKGDINAPTVFNSVFNFRQFWDGRAKSLAEQALGPIENPIEMGNNFKELIPKLKKTEYNKLFLNIYKDGISKDNIADAISEFEKTLITPNSPFDKYLKGDIHAITKNQKEGYQLFKEKGCISCHHGVNVGGNLYSKFGVIVNPNIKHLGKYNFTKKDKDKYYFKVPSLRNIEKTLPYFHDGSIDNLNKAVKLMSLYQLGREITDMEVSKIVEFLKSLNGVIPKSEK